MRAREMSQPDVCRSQKRERLLFDPIIALILLGLEA